MQTEWRGPTGGRRTMSRSSEKQQPERFPEQRGRHRGKLCAQMSDVYLRGPGKQKQGQRTIQKGRGKIDRSDNRSRESLKVIARYQWIQDHDQQGSQQ